MKIGLGQIDIVWEDKEANKIQCRKMMEDAKKRGVDFILFPEMTLTGFSMNPDFFGENLQESKSISFFAEEAKKNSIAVGFGLIAKNTDKAENHCIIIAANGEVIADYAKIHPFSFGMEMKYYSGGNLLSFCEIKDICISPLICYDLRFPEIFQACSAKSSLITVISNWPTQRRGHWISLLQARAIENQCFIAGINRCGFGGNLSYSGDSMIISPYGDILAHACDLPQLVVADIDLRLVEEYRSQFPLKADRKPMLYQKFYNTAEINGKL